MRWLPLTLALTAPHCTEHPSQVDFEPSQNPSQVDFERPAKERQPAVISGEIDSETSSVFFLEVTTPSGTAVCSATLITEHLLLTAAHCLTGQFGPVDCDTDTIGEALPVDNFRASNEPDLTGAPAPSWEFPAIAGVHLLTPGAPLCGADLGLLELQNPSQVDALPPLAGFPITPDHEYRAVGYGAAHPSGTGERVRRGSSPRLISCVGTEPCSGIELAGTAGAPAFPAPPVQDGEFIGTPGACPGDSGGPAFVAFEGTDVVAGVLSRGTPDCETNIYTALDTEALELAAAGITGETLSIIGRPTASPPADGGNGGQGGAVSPPPPPGQPNNPQDSPPTQVDSGCNCRLDRSPRSQPPGGFAALLGAALLIRRRRKSRVSSNI